MTQPRTLWAAYAGSPDGQEITLHATERKALLACMSALGIDTTAPEDDELRAILDDQCSSRSDDWHVEEVQIP